MSAAGIGRFRCGLLLAASLGAALLLSACEGPLSTLSPAGTSATQVSNLFRVMIAVAAAVWLFVMAAAAYSAHKAPGPGSIRSGHRLIVGGGIILPLVLLGTLSYFGFRQANALLAPADGLSIHVTGERWWWRVRYHSPVHGPVVSANEIRLPVGERVQFLLEATDVIHSFWIPSLGGKMDMIPGRVNRLALEAEREGRFRGACAEFCGLSHTLMEFDVVAMAPAAFEAWLANQAADAAAPSGTQAEQGQALFLMNGCGACHRVAGTPADGIIGPDLTHVGSRLSIAAGTLPNEPEAVAGWIAHSSGVKDGALMPRYAALGQDELLAIASYLAGLE